MYLKLSVFAIILCFSISKNIYAQTNQVIFTSIPNITITEFRSVTQLYFEKQYPYRDASDIIDLCEETLALYGHLNEEYSAILLRHIAKNEQQNRNLAKATQVYNQILTTQFQEDKFWKGDLLVRERINAHKALHQIQMQQKNYSLALEHINTYSTLLSEHMPHIAQEAKLEIIKHRANILNKLGKQNEALQLLANGLFIPSQDDFNQELIIDAFVTTLSKKYSVADLTHLHKNLAQCVQFDAATEEASLLIGQDKILLPTLLSIDYTQSTNRIAHIYYNKLRKSTFYYNLYKATLEK